MTTKHKKVLLIVFISIISAGLLASIAVNIYLAFTRFDSYLQSTDEVYIMEAGILNKNLACSLGKDYEFTYDFDNEEYTLLKSKYGIEKFTADGSEFEKAIRLMNEYAPRLKHQSDYDNHVEMNALALLEYSLDNKKHGINCRSKAQILNEMLLASGIYARKVWIMPNSEYDNDCHVVNEVWDTKLNKWIMLDITNNEYWVDENGVPLSILEIRYKGAKNEFCTPVEVGDKTDNLLKLKEKHIADFIYIMKNMVYMKYCDQNTLGEGEMRWWLLPETFKTKYEYIVSEASVLKSPVA